MMAILKTVRQSTGLPSVALFLTSIGLGLYELSDIKKMDYLLCFLGLRVILTLRILQLSANLWYRRKLEKELYDTLN